MGFVLCWVIFLAESSCQATETPGHGVLWTHFDTANCSFYTYTTHRKIPARWNLSWTELSFSTLKWPNQPVTFTQASSVFPQLSHVCSAFSSSSAFSILVFLTPPSPLAWSSTLSPHTLGNHWAWPLMLADHFTSTCSHCSNTVQTAATCENTQTCLNHRL